MESSGLLVRGPKLFLSLCPLSLLEIVAILRFLDRNVWIMKQKCVRSGVVEGGCYVVVLKCRE